MSFNDTTVSDQVNKKTITTTPVVDAISAASIYVDPAVWSKIITHKSGKPHWLAIIWFSKLLYWYERSKVFHEVTGDFLGYKKKFFHHKLQRSQADLAKEVGCTAREAKSIVDALLRANLITQELRSFPDLKLYNVMYIEPIPENILCIMHPKGVHKDTPGTSERTTPGTSERTTPGTSERTTNTLCSNTLSSNTLNSTLANTKGGNSVDNSGQLPTSSPPTKKTDNLYKKKRKPTNEYLNDAAETLLEWKLTPDCIVKIFSLYDVGGISRAISFFTTSRSHVNEDIFLQHLNNQRSNKR